jgi:hypothetical protein
MQICAEVKPNMATVLEGPSGTDKRGGTKVGSAPDGSAVNVYVLKHEGIDAAIMTYRARLTSLRTPDRHGFGEAKEWHGRRTGLCLETQHFPDSPDHSNFPTAELLPGRWGRSTTTFEFSVDTP